MKTYNAQEFQVWLGQWDSEIQVVEAIKSRGIKGIPKCNKKCIIANLIRSEWKIPVSISCASILTNRKVAESDCFVIPQSFKTVIKKFDDGEYPKLEKYGETNE
jgi:hypothetical protein